MEALFNTSTLLLLACTLAIAAMYYAVNRKSPKQEKKSNKQDVEDIQNNNVQESSSDANSQALIAPGPKPLPIIGNLHQLAKYEQNPFEGFTELAAQYGSVYSLKMGTTPAIVVNSTEGLKEVLITKGTKFDGRPDFHRWNLYFDGDRQQSLALCDWSELQKTRRAIIRSFLLMKSHSHNHENLDSALTNEMNTLMAEFDKSAGSPIMAKIPIQLCAMNVFMQYMCDIKFEYSDAKFRKVTKEFDLIFEDINSGHPTDFLPWLSPFFRGHLNKIKGVASNIRTFLLENIVNEHFNNENPDKTKNVLEGLLSNHKKPSEQEVSMDWSNLLFALEDLLGGSSAIGNVMLRVLTFVAQHPDVQQKLQEEADNTIGSDISISIDHRKEMPYTEATIMEVLRHTSSPIVPHVANSDTTIGEYQVIKGTVVFLNNYGLNMSEDHWTDPKAFNPERFIKNGIYKKPANFLPFSTGKRACVGSKILMHVCFVTLVNIIQKFNVAIPESEEAFLPVGRLSVVGAGFNMLLNHRTRG